jgi:diguanylate cyclase (GGDEF)-like protein
MNEYSQSNNELSDLQKRFIKELPTKLSRLKTLWDSMQYVQWNTNTFNLLYRLVHHIVGSAATLQFDSLADDARQLEQIIREKLDQNEIPTKAEAESIAEHVLNLYRYTDEEPTATPFDLDRLSRYKREFSPLVFVVDDDENVAKTLKIQLESCGFQVETFYQLSTLHHRLQQSTPDLLVLDIVFPDSSMGGIEALKRIRMEAGENLPVVFISARSDMVARLRAMRAGGNAYFAKPIEIPEFVDKINELITPDSKQSSRVLIIDDDEATTQIHAAMLRKAGIDSRVQTKPLEAIKDINEYAPHLILLDMHMPGCDGLELATVLRQEPSYEHIPIIFLTADSSDEYKERSYQLHNCDFIRKPVPQEELAAIVRQHIKQSNRFNAKMSELELNHKSLGMVTRHQFFEQLEKAVAIHNHGETRHHLLYLSLDQIGLIRKQFGLVHLDELFYQVNNRISHLMRNEDIASSLTDGVIAILTSRPAQSAVSLAKILCKEIHQEPFGNLDSQLNITCSTGVIPLTTDINSAHDALRLAESASDTASSKGGNGVEYITSPVVNTANIESGEQDENKLKATIADAIANQRYHLVYQPIVTMSGSESEFFEVLFRMKDEHGKVLLPSQFFPLVKEQGIEAETDRWIIENAINRMAKDSRAQLNATLFIKVGDKALKKPFLLPSMSNALNSARIRGEQRLVGMVSEKVLLENMNVVGKFIDGMHNLKCGFAIEHFGNSAYSFKLLEKHQVDYVKLDSYLVKNAVKNEKEKANLAKLIDGVRQKGTEIIATAIEEPATMAFLYQHGVKYFQGFFIQQPEDSLSFNFEEAVVDMM